MTRGKLFKIVKKSIDEWNPYCLLPYAPDDEFNVESLDITSQIGESSNVDEIATIISNVFSKAFDECFEIDACLKVAQKIKSDIESL